MSNLTFSLHKEILNHLSKIFMIAFDFFMLLLSSLFPSPLLSTVHVKCAPVSMCASPASSSVWEFSFNCIGSVVPNYFLTFKSSRLGWLCPVCSVVKYSSLCWN